MQSTRWVCQQKKGKAKFCRKKGGGGPPNREPNKPERHMLHGQTPPRTLVTGHAPTNNTDVAFNKQPCFHSGRAVAYPQIACRYAACSSIR